MKNSKKAFSVLLAAFLCGQCMLNANALEYKLSGADDFLFAQPTSDNVVYEIESQNVDRSKNAAKVAPGFGSQTSYLPNSGEYLTPNLVPGALNGGLVNAIGNVSYTSTTTSTDYPSVNTSVSSSSSTASGSGSVVYPSVSESFSYSFEPNQSAATVSYTEVTSDSYYSGGYLGTLKIPSIGVNSKIYQGTDSSAMAKGIGHFKDSSIWAGNVCLAAHNRGTNAIFGKIHTLNIGDEMTLTTKEGTRTYAVTSVEKISETDGENLSSTSDNRLTLYTCVMDERPYRWCVVAIEA